MPRSMLVLLAGLVCLCALPLRAQDAILGQMYGNGVHAYFSGDYVQAHELLTSAINAGSHDPRCYYYRGLAYLKLGRPQEAEGDFQQGAKLETGNLSRPYNVAKALERIQGPSRIKMEQYRVKARMAAAAEGGDAMGGKADEGPVKVGAGEIQLPTADTCTKCHNKESPSFKAFNFDEYKKKIAHPDPRKAGK